MERFIVKSAMEKKKNNWALILAIIALFSAMYIPIFPVIPLMAGWATYRRIKEKYRISTRVILIVASVDLAIKIAVGTLLMIGVVG